MKLNLGSNIRPMAGFTNVDFHKYDGVDVVANLEDRWPFDDKSVEAIHARDISEHLRQCYERPDPELMEAALEHNRRSEFQEAFNCLMQALAKPKRTYGVIHFMEEAWRVLKHGGDLELITPSTDGRGWAQDPTHVSFWNENTLLYFAHPGYMKIYPDLIRSRWMPIDVQTNRPDSRGTNWIMARLRAIHEEDDDGEPEEEP